MTRRGPVRHFLAALLALTAAPSVHSLEYEISQLTDDALIQNTVVLSSPRITWDAHPFGASHSDFVVYLHDGTTTIPLSNPGFGGAGAQAISGATVVWGACEDLGDECEIFVYDGATRQLTPSNDGFNNDPARISWSTIAWTQQDIETSELTVPVYDGTSTTLLDYNGLACCPDVSGSKVAFVGFDGSDYEILLYDGTTTTQLTNNNLSDSDPRISGTNVVWNTFDGNDSEIFAYDGGSVRQLTDNAWPDGNPKISGDRVVWTASSLGVFVHDLSDGTTTLIGGPGSVAHDISGTIVVWTNDPTPAPNDQQVFVFDGITSTQLVTSSINDSGARVSGADVVWVGHTANDEGEIFHARLILDQLVLSPGDSHTAVLLGGSTNPGGVEATLGTVESPGALTADYETQTPQQRSDCVAAGTCPPLNFAVPGTVTQNWQIGFAGSFAGFAQLVFRYSQALLGSFNESRLAVYHFVHGAWKRLPTVIDPDNDLLTVEVPEADGFSPFVIGALPACQDGEDNDGDLLVDLADGGCTDGEDRSEEPDCEDGLSNDADGLADYPVDPGCTGPTDPLETNSAKACDDGLDNDGDGKFDYPADPDCASPTGVRETRLPPPQTGCGFTGLEAFALVAALRWITKRRSATPTR